MATNSGNSANEAQGSSSATRAPGNAPSSTDFDEINAHNAAAVLTSISVPDDDGSASSKGKSVAANYGESSSSKRKSSKGKAVAIGNQSLPSKRKSVAANYGASSSSKRKGVAINKKRSSSKPKHLAINSKGSSSSKGKSAPGGFFADDEWTDEIRFCPTYRPTKEEFEDPVAYLQKISPTASRYGICKIVSPLSPRIPPATMLTDLGKFRAEYIYLNTDFREKKYQTKRMYNIKEFEEMANHDYDRNYDLPAYHYPYMVERDFWKKVDDASFNKCVEYVNGLDASAFPYYWNDPLESRGWNLQRFAKNPESALRFLNKDIKGVTTPMLYIGMLDSFDYWHAEHGHMNRIDYHHYGSPKTWYGVPTHAASEFERVVQKFVFPEKGLEDYEAYDVLNWKALLFSPEIVHKHYVPVYKAVQNPGEFIVTFPKVYHTGFSHGFTCSEAVNFTTRDWFPFGAEASERRALYAAPAIIPYQVLLCREAEDLFYNKRSEMESPSYRNLKLYFSCLIRVHHFACAELRKSGASIAIAPVTKNFKLCCLCNRECYLASITCKCTPPICIFHDVYLGCRCKEKRVMWVKERILDLQDIADDFEDGDPEFVEEVKALLERCGETLGCLPSRPEAGLKELISMEAWMEKVNPVVPRRKRS